MELEQKPVSVLKDEGFCAGRILAREASVGRSSRIFFRAAEGVPFEWEMLPGTPKNPQDDSIPPLSPPPQMHSLGLPLPNLDHIDKATDSKALRIRSLKKMVKKGKIKVEMLRKRRGSSKREEKSSDGEFVESVKDSSFSSYSSSSLLSFSPNGEILDSVDGPFCCSPSNVSTLLDEGDTKIYYCRQHKAAFAVEEDGSMLSRILSRVSVADEFSGPLNSGITPAGIPFDWEMQPGTPKHPQENELIPPPSPPPAVQSSTLPLPKVHHVGEEEEEEKANETTWKRTWFWARRKYKTKTSAKVDKDISFKCRHFDASFRESASMSSLSSVAPFPKGEWRVSKINRGLKGGRFGCGPWTRKEILSFATRKLKSFTY